MKTIWTVGHSTRGIEEFVGLLRAQGIEALADVRQYPGSKRFPHFGKDALKGALEAAGIEYRHVPALGGRRKPREDSVNTAWRNEAFRGYADYMESEGFREGIGELVGLAEGKRTAVMCSEAVWWRCHRSLISDYLKSVGWTVLHVMGEGAAEEHPYTSAARIVGGRLEYKG